MRIAKSLKLEGHLMNTAHGIKTDRPFQIIHTNYI